MWNGVTLFHFVVEHTHTFCEDETTHTHTSTEECLTIFQLSQSHDQMPAQTNNEFQKLKQFIAPTLLVATAVQPNLQQSNFINLHLKEELFLKAIFQPPIAA